MQDRMSQRRGVVGEDLERTDRKKETCEGKRVSH
jgi:hypothetical protein